MLTAHGYDLAVAVHQNALHLQAAPQHLEAGALRVIRNAVLVILAIAFLIGVFLGFIIGRAVYRRR